MISGSSQTDRDTTAGQAAAAAQIYLDNLRVGDPLIINDIAAAIRNSSAKIFAADNALPHLLNEQDLLRAVQQIAGKLRPGGLFLGSIRDYDQIVEQHPAMPPPAFFQDGAHRRIYHQVWDWTSDRQYTVHLYITQEARAGWTCRHFVSVYRAVLRQELTAVLHQAGFVELRWLMPADSGFYQPLVLARNGKAPHTTSSDWSR